MDLFGKKDKVENPPVVQTPAVKKVATKSSPKDKALDTTYFGKNLKIKGNVSGVDGLIILGSFDGEFNLKGRLQVAQSARIKGNIKATDIYVNGSIEGAITASEKVRIDSTARIKGDITAPKISVIEGAMFDGKIKMSNRSTQESKPVSPGPKQTSRVSVTPNKEETVL